MQEFRLTHKSDVPRTLEETFVFFSDARNLELLTPPWIRFEIATPEPIVMGVGTLLDYRLKIRGMPLRWRSEITVWEPPAGPGPDQHHVARFVDVQVRGPYRKWVHEHVFEATSDGTRVIDHVTYAVPGGWLVERLLVGPDVRRIFDYRGEALRRILG